MATAPTTTTPRAAQQAADEAAIRRRLDQMVKALHAMDLDGLLSIYAPDVVSFDIDPPLWYQGSQAKRQRWSEVFGMYRPPMEYEIRDLSISVSGDLAFSHSLNRMNATLKNGEQTDFWLRWTACFRKIDGDWLIVHEQISVPTDFPSGKALLDLKP